MAIQLGLRRPHRAVDALQHRLIVIALPIGTGQFEQLKGFADLAGVVNMWAATQVGKLPLAIDRECLMLWNTLN
jgi:hypothetical protein